MGMRGWLVGLGCAGGLAGGCQSFTQAIGGDPGTSSDTGAADDASSANPTTGTPTATTGGADGTTGAVDPSATTGGEDSSTGPTGPVCGNGVPELGEECDDGNADNTDDCTDLCTIPTCDDGLLDGSETDVDCGGGRCKGCMWGAACLDPIDCGDGLLCLDTATCMLPPSCLAVLMLDPAAASGEHDIDPDGDGIPTPFYCDMVYDGGGWTRVYAETFTGGADPGWSNTTVTDCGSFTGLLGGYGEFANTEVYRDVDLLGVPHTEARIRTRWIFIDSWDGEDAYGQIDGVEAFSVSHNFGAGGSECGQGWEDTAQAINGVLPNASGLVEIRFGSNLTQDPTNESWGLDNVFVFVR